MTGTVFINSKSGANAAEDDPAATIAAALHGVKVEECPPEDLDAALDAQISAGAEWVGVAGGDGTIRSAAQRLAGSETALLAVPMGTLNHFARQLGISTLDDAAAAVDGSTIAVDVGDVNDKVFVNNASIGLYPLLVEGRERRLHRLPKRLADLAALSDELRRGKSLSVCIDGEMVSTWMVFIGNNVYCSGLFDITERESVTDGVVDIRLVRAEARFSRLRVVGAALFKRLDRSPLIERRVVAEIVIEPDPKEVSVALDGEVEELLAPLRFRSRKGALKVRVPSTPYDAADAAEDAARGDQRATPAIQPQRS
ncbi:MAG: hypothetical protein NVS3B21_05020 [Acidimicrobiales bacterium]